MRKCIISTLGLSEDVWCSAFNLQATTHCRSDYWRGNASDPSHEPPLSACQSGAMRICCIGVIIVVWSAHFSSTMSDYS